jgi:UDP-N-acetylmuramoyl-tripeptide--D-alanyl-D-alanine ligase
VITLDAKRAGQALGVGALAAPVTGVSIDSRSLRPGDLFVALRGERFDGHDYIEAALAAGASGVVVEREAWAARGARVSVAAFGAAQGTQDARVHQVADTLAALGALAREVRRASGVLVFGITGSAGKTSTKDLLKAMVSRVRSVVATPGNQNNQVGGPLTLLAVEPGTEAVVVEMGMRGRGQIAELAAIAEPDVGIITNVHPVHLELLGSLENIAEAKAELIAGMRPGGTAVVPAGCEPLRVHLARCSCRVVSFSAGTVADGAETGGVEVRDADVRGWLEPAGDCGYAWVLRWPGGETRVATDYLPKHTIENAVAAAAACYAAGLPVGECAAGIVDVQLSHGRGQTVEVSGLCLIDDTYNANPAAVRAALDHLVRLATERNGRAVAVLGDMLELGPEEERFHEQIGAHAAQAGVSALWGVGPLSEATVRGFRSWWTQNGVDGQGWSAEHLGSCEDAGSLVAGLRAGDVVLVKASRSVRLENVVIRVVDEAKAGRWGGGAAHADVDGDVTGEKRHCYR